MGHQVKAPVTKPDDLTSIPGDLYDGEKRTSFRKMSSGMMQHTHAHKNNKLI